MLLCIQPVLMSELLFDYENICQDEDLMESDEYHLYQRILNKLIQQNKRQEELPTYENDEVQDIVNEVEHIETSNIGGEKELKRAIRLFYMQNGFAQEVTLDQLKDMAAWSSSTGRYSMPFHWKSKGKIFVLKDSI